MGKRKVSEAGSKRAASFKDELVKQARGGSQGSVLFGRREIEAEAHAVNRVSSLCLPLDKAMGGNYIGGAFYGGFPAGRITEVIGETSEGKSIIALQALAGTILAGGVAIYQETEHAWDHNWIDRLLKSYGIKKGIDELIILEPETIEEVMFNTDHWSNKAREVDPNKLVCVAWDSIAATMAKNEVDKDERHNYGPGQIGSQARALSVGLRKLQHNIKGTNTVFVMINQVRANIGVRFGEKTSTPGGRAPGFYASVLIQLTGEGKLYRNAAEKTEGKMSRVHAPIGVSVCAYLKKNKTAPPFRKAFFPIYWEGANLGVWDHRSWFGYLKDRKIIQNVTKQSLKLTDMSGAEYQFVGETGFLKLLKNPEVEQHIRNLVVMHDFKDASDGSGTVDEGIKIEDDDEVPVKAKKAKRLEPEDEEIQMPSFDED